MAGESGGGGGGRRRRGNREEVKRGKVGGKEGLRRCFSPQHFFVASATFPPTNPRKVFPFPPSQPAPRDLLHLIKVSRRDRGKRGVGGSGRGAWLAAREREKRGATQQEKILFLSSLAHAYLRAQQSISGFHCDLRDGFEARANKHEVYLFFSSTFFRPEMGPINCGIPSGIRAKAPSRKRGPVPCVPRLEPPVKTKSTVRTESDGEQTQPEAHGHEEDVHRR